MTALDTLALAVISLAAFTIAPLVLKWGKQLEIGVWLFVAASVVIRIASWYDASLIDEKAYPEDISLGPWYLSLLFALYGFGFGLALRAIVVFCLPYIGLRGYKYGSLEAFKRWLWTRGPAELSLPSKLLLLWPMVACLISLLLMRGRDELLGQFWTHFHVIAAVGLGVAIGVAFCNAPIRWVLSGALPAILFQVYFYWMDRRYVGAPMWNQIASYLGTYLALILVPAYIAAKLRYRPHAGSVQAARS